MFISLKEYEKSWSGLAWMKTVALFSTLSSIMMSQLIKFLLLMAIKQNMLSKFTSYPLEQSVYKLSQNCLHSDAVGIQTIVTHELFSLSAPPQTWIFSSALT